MAAHLGAALGESPVWDVDRQLLHFVDILEQRIHQFDPATGMISSIPVDGAPGAIALKRDGGYIAGIGLDFTAVEDGGSLRPIARATAGDRINDGKCDARGRFVSGTMDNARVQGRAALYQLGVDGTLTVLRSDVTLSNGIDWNLSNDVMYYIDTTTERVDVFDYEIETGLISDRRMFADLQAAPGRPDGLTVDSEGGVWVAVARAGLIHRYDPAGKLDQVVEVPTPVVTSCAFGGPDHTQLFVTSSRGLLSPEQQREDRLAGDVFVIEGLGVRGRPAFRYGP
ncbi:MAG: SMP-30/gluconolactonase/LRE family protein [Gemmatimonadaceae bacterium]